MIYVQLLGGLLLLVVFGDILVRGAVDLSHRLGIPPLIVGLTVVAFGTSAPELVVSVKAALENFPGIAVGNVVGSNIANILLVLGLPAIICATRCDHHALDRNTYIVLGTSILFAGLCFLTPMTFWDGALLFGLLIAFLWLSAHRAMRSRAAESLVPIEDDVPALPGSIWVPVGALAVGLIGLPICAHITVDGAAAVATVWGVSDTVIGLTIVAIGTSLPELATTVVAALRGHGALALGNVLGSNLFNMLAIVGITAMLTPLAIPQEILRLDIWVMLAATVLLVPFVVWRVPIGRIAGIVFLCAYAFYIGYLLTPATQGALVMAQ
ncbi:MAG: calcium/sodium antiporter [Dichotomicrobium sp.]